MTKKNRSLTRLRSLDLLKGFFMFYIIILHPVIQRVFQQDVSEFENQMTSIPTWLVVIGTPFILISLWGTAFTLMTGTTTAFKMAKVSKNPNKNIRKELQSRSINGSLLYFVHFVLMAFFYNMSQDHPMATHSLVTGSIELGKLNIPGIVHLLTSSTLESIAFTGVSISVVLYITWRKGYNYKKGVRNLAILGGIVVGASIILNQTHPNPSAHAEVLLMEKNYFGYYLFTRMHVVRFSIFPVFAFGIAGAIVGIAMAEKKSFKDVFKTGAVISCISFALFGIHVADGLNILEDFAEENVPLSLQFMNLGLQVLVIMGIARLLDYRKEDKNAVNPKSILGRLQTITDRYGNGSLTIFVLEPLYSIIVYKTFTAINGGPIAKSPVMIFLYVVIIVLSWFFGLKTWKKHNYKYGFEWFVGKMKKKLLSYRRNNPFVQLPELESGTQIQAPVMESSNLPKVKEKRP